jgi:hypothetical protein
VFFRGFNDVTSNCINARRENMRELKAALREDGESWREEVEYYDTYTLDDERGYEEVLLVKK